jgi:hypothetical protein
MGAAKVQRAAADAGKGDEGFELATGAVERGDSAGSRDANGAAACVAEEKEEAGLKSAVGAARVGERIGPGRELAAGAANESGNTGAAELREGGEAGLVGDMSAAVGADGWETGVSGVESKAGLPADKAVELGAASFAD